MGCCCFYIVKLVLLNPYSCYSNCIELNKELPFTDKDVKGFFTLANYDLVSFQICTDRRNGAQRACNITFMPESFTLNSEVRERGYVASLKVRKEMIESALTILLTSPPFHPGNLRLHQVPQQGGLPYLLQADGGD